VEKIEKKNVFSDNVDTISILVHTEKFLGDNPTLDFLCNANKLSQIRIYFIPVLSEQENCKVDIGEYSYFKYGVFTNVTLHFADCSSVISVHNHLPEDIKDIDIYRLSEENIVKGQLISNQFDYVVTKDVFSDQEKCDIPVISIERCKELLRLFLVKKKQYEVCEHYYTDETFYYYIIRGGCMDFFNEMMDYDDIFESQETIYVGKRK